MATLSHLAACGPLQGAALRFLPSKCRPTSSTGAELLLTVPNVLSESYFHCTKSRSHETGIEILFLTPSFNPTSTVLRLRSPTTPEDEHLEAPGMTSSPEAEPVLWKGLCLTHGVFHDVLGKAPQLNCAGGSLWPQQGTQGACFLHRWGPGSRVEWGHPGAQKSQQKESNSPGRKCSLNGNTKRQQN